MKKKIFAANWKMNKTPQQADDFAVHLKNNLKAEDFKSLEVFIFPQNFSLDRISSHFLKSDILFGPQHIHTELKGAFTGENSIELAQALGVKICLIGHSERRQFFSETDSLINSKVKLCLEKSILPVLCIGESLSERQSGQTLNVCFHQMTEALKNIDSKNKIVLAYEPVWAIGTGQVASLAQVKEVHLELFNKMTQLGFLDFQILYGGSVKPENAKELLSVPHVDGFLIGGASLEAESFLKIIKN